MNCEKLNFNMTKFTCYYSYLAGASVFVLPAILFTTLRQMYSISYTLLGTLVLVNFSTQLIVDLIFTFFSHRFSVRKTVIIMPILTAIGLLVYATAPYVFSGAVYVGFLIGTVLFSASAGLSEVLLSPIVAAIPSKTKDRDMAALHSLYAYGVLLVVLVSSVYLAIFKSENWMYLVLGFALLPVVSVVLFAVCPLPDIKTSQENGKGGFRINRGLLLCAACIFLGAAGENSMTNWISGFMERALGISKTMGDILGIALFAVLLGIVRTLYAKYGRNISAVLLIGMLGTVLCYLTAGLVTAPLVCAAACVFTGVFTSMLWPGTLIFMEEKMPRIGVAAYALMAAGGDMGSSIAPQLHGVVTDTVSQSGWAAELSSVVSLSTEQIGMKCGMLVSAIFPMLGAVVVVLMMRHFKRSAS